MIKNQIKQFYELLPKYINFFEEIQDYGLRIKEEVQFHLNFYIESLLYLEEKYENEIDQGDWIPLRD